MTTAAVSQVVSDEDVMSRFNETEAVLREI